MRSIRWASALIYNFAGPLPDPSFFQTNKNLTSFPAAGGRP